MTALAGAGYEPAMWRAELTAMYFAAGKQNITTYKGNNAGQDMTSEINKHYDYDYASQKSMLSVTAPSTPPVDRKRYLDNITNSYGFERLLLQIQSAPAKFFANREV